MSSYVDKQDRKNLVAAQRRNLEVIEDFMTSVLLQLITIEPSFAPSSDSDNYAASMNENSIAFKSSKYLSERSRRNVKAVIIENLKENFDEYGSESPYLTLSRLSLECVTNSAAETIFYVKWLFTGLGDVALRKLAFHEHCQDFYGALRCVRAEHQYLRGLLPAIPATLKAQLKPSLQSITKFFEDRKDKHVVTFNKEQFNKHFRRPGESDFLFIARVDLHFKQNNLFVVFAGSHVIITRDTNHSPVQLGAL